MKIMSDKDIKERCSIGVIDRSHIYSILKKNGVKMKKIMQYRKILKLAVGIKSAWNFIITEDKSNQIHDKYEKLIKYHIKKVMDIEDCDEIKAIKILDIKMKYGNKVFLKFTYDNNILTPIIIKSFHIMSPNFQSRMNFDKFLDIEWEKIKNTESEEIKNAMIQYQNACKEVPSIMKHIKKLYDKSKHKFEDNFTKWKDL